jgi:hypothetical protein
MDEYTSAINELNQIVKTLNGVGVDVDIQFTSPTQLIFRINGLEYGNGGYNGMLQVLRGFYMGVFVFGTKLGYFKKTQENQNIA